MLENRRFDKVRWVSDLPKRPRWNTLYVVGGRRHAFWLAYRCPRGYCEMVSHIPIVDESHDCKWGFEEHADGTVSLHPSVLVHNCGCHYFLKCNEIQWCADTPQKPHKMNW